MTTQNFNCYFYAYFLLIICSGMVVGSCLPLRGSEPVLHDQGSNSMLMVSVKSNDLDVVRSSLSLGADVNFLDEWGNTPLFYAAHKGHEAVVKCLMQHGANHEISNEVGEFAIKGARFLKCKNIYEILKVASNPQDACSFKVLLRAAYNEEVGFIRWLMSIGVGIDTVDEYEWTVLSTASYYKKLRVVKILLDAGADIDRPSKFSITPLHRACNFYHVNTARFLLDHGASINLHDFFRDTPLMNVVSKRRKHVSSKEETIKLLLSRGALFSSDDLNKVSIKKYKTLLIKNEEVPYNYFASVRSILEEKGLPKVLSELACIDMIAQSDMQKKVKKRVSLILKQGRNEGLRPRKKQKTVLKKGVTSLLRTK